MAEPFVGTEDALQVGMGGQDGLGDFGRLQLVAGAVLDIDDLDIRVLRFDAGSQSRRGGRCRCARSGRGRPAPTLPAPPISSAILSAAKRGGGKVVGGDGGRRDVAVNARVEGDDRDAGLLRLLQQRDCGLAVQRGKADGGGLLRQGGGQHVHLLVDLGFGVRAFKGDFHTEFGGGLVGARLHGLPELVLEAFRDQRDVELVLRQGRCRSLASKRAARRAKKGSSVQHRFPPDRMVDWYFFGNVRRSLLCSAGATSAQHVCVDGDDDDEAGHHGLPFLRPPT